MIKLAPPISLACLFVLACGDAKPVDGIDAGAAVDGSVAADAVSELDGSSSLADASSADARPGDAGVLSTASIDFPSMRVMIDTPTIWIRGRASNPAGIGGVAINGQAAASSDGFATWTVEVDLSLGSNTLSVSVTDGAGARTDDAASVEIVRVDPLLSDPRNLAIYGSIAYVYDAIRRSILTVNIGTGARRILVPRVRALNPANDGQVVGMRASATRLVFTTPDSVQQVDVSTGVVSMISASGSPSGPAIDNIRGAAFFGNVGWLADYDADAIIAVDLTDGSRRTITATGTGPALVNPHGVAHRSGNFIYVAHQPATGRETLRINIATGDRTVFASNGVQSPSRPDVDSRNRIVYQNGFWIRRHDGTSASNLFQSTRASGAASVGSLWLASDDELFFCDQRLGAIHHLDVTANTRTEVTRSGLQAEPIFNPAPIRRFGDEVYVMDKAVTASGNVLELVDLVSGTRTALSRHDLGTGYPLYNSRYLIVNQARTIAWTTEASNNAIHKIMLLGGSRTRLGNSTTLGTPGGFAIDESADLAYVLDSSQGLIRQIRTFNLSAGTSQIIGSETVGSGPVPDLCAGVAHDTTGGRLLLACRDEILALDIATQVRTAVVSGAYENSLRQVVVDPTEAGAFYFSDNTSLWHFSPTNGLSTIIDASSAGIPLGLRSLQIDGAARHATFFSTSLQAIVELDLVTRQHAILYR